MSRIMVFPGSFDPPTSGHLDIIQRAAALADELVVSVVVNPAKEGLFTLPKRVELLTEITAHLPGVRVDSFTGLLVDHCRELDATAIVKGVRGQADFEYEQQMAQMNRSLTGVDTVFLATAADLSFISSSLVKQVAGLGGPVDHLVPLPVAAALRWRLAR